MFHDLDVPAQFRLDPFAEAFLLVPAIGPHQLEPRKHSLERREQALAAPIVLDAGLVHEQVQDQPHGIDEQVPLAAFDLLAPIEAARPPFCVVFTD